MIPWTTDESIHRIVKRDIPISERGAIATLNDLPGWMVEEARAIAHESRLGAVRYLRFYVATHHASSAEDFVEDVLLKGEDAQTWHVRDCLFVPEDPIRISELDINQYLDVLRTIDGERWFRIKPTSSDHLSDYITGMVGVVKRQCRYWQTPPEGVVRCPLVQSTEAEHIMSAQLQSAVRRWIAHRLAWWARQHLEQYRLHTSGNAIISAVADSDTSSLVTSDTRIAANALAREARAYGNSSTFPQQAGFLGPEEWYQSSPGNTHTQPG